MPTPVSAENMATGRTSLLVARVRYGFLVALSLLAGLAAYTKGVEPQTPTQPESNCGSSLKLNLRNTWFLSLALKSTRASREALCSSGFGELP
jgi:hypothetical protein